ncbi:putative c2h2 type zinc finger domain containing protein [Golovinomyces cichoracearum]|uniref:Putative c2h2 type zinc finger domain containing protein n=1 Tax=Golovinomyces cichoracearum TaxID=62708 RepID=A0A420INH8_9PEZI|nr:putative c2h2 type zinc finger domain containing protein [Golovinomyces cichoracearum]
MSKELLKKDVLIRHLKNHPRLSEQENENEQLESVSTRDNFQDSDPKSTSIAASLHPLHARCQFSQTKSRATQYLGVPNNEHTSIVQPFTSGLDHLATLASHQDYGRDVLDPVIRVEPQETFHDSSPYTLTDTNSTQDWDHIQPTSQQNSQIDPNLDPRLTQPEKCFRPLDKNAGTISCLNSNGRL